MICDGLPDVTVGELITGKKKSNSKLRNTPCGNTGGHCCGIFNFFVTIGVSAYPSTISFVYLVFFIICFS